MNTKLKLSLLKQLSLRTSHRGFTLIELLVVVIIIGVLAAIALPNLLGQVRKAREAEARTMVGAMNRAQQSYYTEYSDFASSMEDLEIPIGNFKYYDEFGIVKGEDNGVLFTLQYARNAENPENGTRDYIGAVYKTQSHCIVPPEPSDPIDPTGTNVIAVYKPYRNISTC